MCKKLIISILALLLIGSLKADEQQFKQANQLYVAKNYEEAIQAYEQVRASGYESAILYYNLGNAYYKTRQFTRAILNYERAKRLAPDNENIAANLDLARLQVGDQIESVPDFFITAWFRGIKGLFSSDAWAVLSVLAFFFLLASVLVFLFSANVSTKRLSFPAAVFLLIISITAFIFSYQQKQEIVQHNTAIVTTLTVNVKSAPDENGTELFIIHEGTKVNISETLDGWYEIKLSDGRLGWLKISDVERI